MNAALALQHTSTELSAPLSFAIPIGDMGEFSEVPEPRRVEVQVTIRILERLHSAIPVVGKMSALRMVAAQHQHQMRGLSPVSLDRKYKSFVQGGWRALVKGYKGPNKQPSEFIQEVRRVAELNHRSQGEAMRQLRERWAAGETIPGYGNWMEHYIKEFPNRPIPLRWPRNYYPAGWSIDNLRRYGPSKGTRAIFQRGIAAAKKHFPSIIRTPENLKPLELIVIDDFVLDCLCSFPGDAEHAPQIAPVAGLMAMDVATRRKLARGLGAAIFREEKQGDGSIRKIRCGIRRVDVQMLLHDLFARYGLPNYTVTILCENATASISAELELALGTLFEGRVRVERTGLIEHRTLTNGFVERGGKPWEKGWIESTFNKLWNIMGAQRGYKGSNERLNGPANLDDAKRYAARLLGQGDGKLNLPAEAIAELRLPFQSVEELERAFDWACALTDSRVDHRFLGFTRVTEYLLEDGDEPKPFSALALVSREAQLSARPVERMESPLERWAHLASEISLTPIPSSVLALILLTPKRVTYKNSSVTFAHDKIGYTYVDPKGDVLSGVQEGTEFLGYFEPSAPEQLHLASLQGAYVGTLQRLGGRRGAIDIRDKAALGEAAAVQATIVNRAIAEIRERHADLDTQAASDRAHNDAVVAKYKTQPEVTSGTQALATVVATAAATESKRKATAAVLQRVGDDDVPSLL